MSSSNRPKDVTRHRLVVSRNRLVVSRNHVVDEQQQPAKGCHQAPAGGQQEPAPAPPLKTTDHCNMTAPSSTFFVRANQNL